MADNETPEVTPVNVFVTDATNSAGFSAAKAFASAGYKVTANVRTTAQAERVRARGSLPAFIDVSRPGEINGILKMTGADIIVNTASQAFNQLPFLGQKLDGDRLVQETQSIVQAAEQSAASLIVHTSFSFLYASAGDEWITEDGKLKKAKEGIIAAARKAEEIVTESSVDSCILRAGFCYGPGGGVLKEVAHALQFGGKALATGTDATLLNWVHSEDLAQAAVLAVEKNMVGEIFNIVDDNPTSGLAFLSNIGRATGIGEFVKVSGGLMDLLGFNRLDETLFDQSVKLCNDKMKDVLGVHLEYPHHLQGIDQTTISWRAAMKA